MTKPTRRRNLFYFFILTIIFTEKVHGESLAAFNFEFCQKDINQFCAGKSHNDAPACLISRNDDISTECKQEIERFIQSRRQAAARGGGALSSFGGLNALGPAQPLFSYEGRYTPGTSSTSLTDHKANISSPIYKGSGETYSLSLAGQDVQFGSPPTLNSGTQVPAELYRVELGAQYFHQLSNMRNWGLRASVGYAGDAPFQNSNDVTYSLGANYGFPGSSNDFWFLGLFFSNNNPLGNFIPIPAFGYFYKTEKLNGLFGFPISSIQWTPAYPWSFSFSLYGPTIQSEAAYGSIDKFQFFFGYYWSIQSYLPVQRLNSVYRLSIQEMKSGLGMRTLVAKDILMELQGGRAFERDLYIGNGVFNQDGGSTTLPDDWYLLWTLKAKL